MVDFEKEFERPGYSTTTQTTAIARTFRIVYGWMTLGLALSGVIAWYVWFSRESGFLEKLLTGHGFTVCIVAEFVVVLALSFLINKMPVILAYLMFLAYAALNGLTLSVIFIAYDIALIQRVFFITAGMFAGLALWGTFTKSNLSSIGAFCGMALWGLIIASVVNIFLGSTKLDFICSFAGILIFTGLTMYDAQKIRQLATAESRMDGLAIHRAGILGALALYLDFVNLFLYILRFFGRKR